MMDPQELREADVRYAEWLPPGHNDEEDAKELSTMLEGEAICQMTWGVSSFLCLGNFLE